MLQNLTECYSQMQQQHEDMLHLQQSFSQLFTQPTSEERTPNARPSATPNAPVSTLGNSCSPNSFSFQPSTSFGYRPQESVRETPPPSPFMSTQVCMFSYDYLLCFYVFPETIMTRIKCTHLCYILNACYFFMKLCCSLSMYCFTVVLDEYIHKQYKLNYQDLF